MTRFTNLAKVCATPPGALGRNHQQDGQHYRAFVARRGNGRIEFLTKRFNFRMDGGRRRGTWYAELGEQLPIGLHPEDAVGRLVH